MDEFNKGINLERASKIEIIAKAIHPYLSQEFIMSDARRLASYVLDELDNLEISEMLESIERDEQTHIGEEYAN